MVTQLVERLEALRYRHVSLTQPAGLVAAAVESKPIVILIDVDVSTEAVTSALQQLRANPVTSHIPAIGFGHEVAEMTQAALVAQGATLVANDAAMLNHLAQLLDRALEVR
jgi:PleD family two-component response regulator